MQWLRSQLVWLFWGPTGQVQYGEDRAYDTFMAIFLLVIATVTTFVIAVNEIPVSAGEGSVVFWALMAVAIRLNAVVMNARKVGAAGDETPAELRHDRSSIVFGRTVLYSTLALAVLVTSLAAFEWFPGQRPGRKDYTALLVPCAEPKLASNFTSSVRTTAGQRDQSAEDTLEMDHVKRWFTLGSLDSAKEQILIIEQYPAFDADYNTFSAFLDFNPMVRFTDALVFLKRRTPVAGGGSLRYRVEPEVELQKLQLATDSQGETHPVIAVPMPNEGDSLLIFARVVAGKNIHGKDIEMQNSAGWFNFKLRRVQR